MDRTGSRGGRGSKAGARKHAPAQGQRAAARRRSAPAAPRERGGAEAPAPLGHHEQLLRAVIDNIPISLWAVDREGFLTYQDGKALEAAGLAPGELLGSSVFDLYDERATAGVQRALAGDPDHTFAEAHGVQWESWLVPVRGEGGEVRSVIGFSLDVTEEKRVEQELRAKLELIGRQQQVIRELSTPIIEVWEGVLTLPMVGVVDSTRTSEVMQDLLSRISQTGARYAILDLTGVDMVDTRVAGHLVSLVSAIQLLGAEGVITGIKPTVAQTMVALGLDLRAMVTRANLRAGLKFCIQQMAKR
jgi:rsbT co-antagonist protein RsbR